MENTQTECEEFNNYRICPKCGCSFEEAGNDSHCCGCRQEIYEEQLGMDN